MIPMIIVGFVVPAIADIGGRAGRLLVITALLAYGFTVMAGLISYLTGSALFPDLVGSETSLSEVESVNKLSPWFTVEMPPLMGVTTSLVLSFVLGLGIAFSSGTALRRGMSEFRDIVSKTINTAIIPLLPVY
ncbi:MAG: cation:dicarboxylase symporter family transporter, partial [Duncaniella sp.]|nr:cation:dicarboxylase symporter family transporter [Duncaniella sp.]